MDIRPATFDDAPGIAAVYAPFVRDTAISFEMEPPTADEMRRRMRGEHRRLPWVVADVDGTVVGYAYASPFRARAAYQWSVEVSVYVDSGAHRRGIGRRLYAALLDRVRRLGYRKIVAGVTLPNVASVALHAALGFVPVGVYHQVGFKFGRWHDVGWWELPLFDGGAPPTQPPLSEHDVSEV